MEIETIQTTAPVYEGIKIWDNSIRAKHLIIVFYTLIAITFIAIISGYMELILLEEVQEGFYISESTASLNDMRQGIVAITQIVIYFLSIVFFLNWFRRAYGNLHRVGVSHLEYKENMAVWTWFIPIIVWFRPVQIMNEIWKETRDKIKKTNPTQKFKDLGFLVGIWWFLFILTNFIGRYITKSLFKEETLEELISLGKVTLASDFLQIIEAGLVIIIVVNISKLELNLVSEIKNHGGELINNPKK